MKIKVVRIPVGTKYAKINEKIGIDHYVGQNNTLSPMTFIVVNRKTFWIIHDYRDTVLESYSIDYWFKKRYDRQHRLIERDLNSSITSMEHGIRYVLARYSKLGRILLSP